MGTNQTNFLQLFGLSENFTERELKEAYRDLAHVWHPDKHTHNDRLRRKAENQLKEINEGYEFLKQVLKRKESSTYTYYSENDSQNSPADNSETQNSTYTYTKEDEVRKCYYCKKFFPKKDGYIHPSGEFVCNNCEHSIVEPTDNSYSNGIVYAGYK